MSEQTQQTQQTQQQPNQGQQGQQNQQQTQQNPIPADKELQIAELNLRLATVKSNAQFNLSTAGQIQREFEAMQRCAQPYAQSTIVPTQYQNNIGNCIIALDLAYRMKLPALTVMQNLYIVNGNPSWASKFLVASINTCGRFTNLRYRKRSLGYFEGTIKYQEYEYDKAKGKKTIVVKEMEAPNIENWECVAYATEKSTGEVLEGDPVTIEMAIKEGWYTKSGSKWVTMPMLMLSYRAAAFWQRVYAPEMSMGFRTMEEEEDIIDVEYEEISEQPKPTAKPTTATIDKAKEAIRAKRAESASKEVTSESKPETKSESKKPNSDSMFDMP